MSQDRHNTALSATDKEMADMDDISDGLVSGIMEQTAMNLDELLQSICRWDSEERVMSEGNDESSADSYTQQKVQQHLEKFFAMRRVFAEHRADKENDATYSGDSETEISHAATAMDKDVRTQQSTSKEKKPVTKRFFKRIKFALKSGFGKMHSKKDEDISDEEDKDEEDTMEKEMDSRSKEEIEETKAEEKITKSIIQPEKEEEYVSQVTEQDIRTQESIDNEATAEKPAKMKFFKSLKTTLKKGFSKNMNPVDVEAEEDDATVEQQTSVGLEQPFIEDFEETKADEPVTKGVIQSDISEKDEKEEEKENVQEREEVRIPETRSSSRLSTRSQESEEAASSDSSSFTTSTINEEPTITISQVTEQDVRTQESFDNEATAEKPTKKKFFKSLKTTLKKGFSKNMNPVDVEAEEDDATVEQQTSVGLEQPFIEDFEETKADELITKGVIQSDISEKDEKEEEKENVQEREEVRIPETGSSSRLSTRSQESEEAASSDSSSFTTSTINEEPTMTISQVTEQEVRTQESFDNKATAEKPTKKKFFKSLKTTLKKGFSKNMNPVDVEAEEDDATVEQQTSVGLEQPFIEDFEETKADELITEGVIQSDISEKDEKEEDKENVQEREEVRIPETGSSSRLFTRSHEIKETALSASSSSSTRAINEEPNMTISQVTEQDVRTQESIDNEATAEKPTKMKFFKSLKTTLKKGFSKNMNPVDVEAEEDDATVEQQTSVGLEQLFIDDFDTKADEQETDIESHIFKKGEEEEGKEETKADEQITESLIQPGISEKEEGKEDIQKRADVRIPETGSSSRLSTRSQEIEEAASSASSSFTTSTINEDPNTTISQVTEQDIRTQETIDNESKTEKPAKKKFFKELKTTLKKGFSKKMTPLDVEAEQEDDTVEQQTSVSLEKVFPEDFDTKADEQETDIQPDISGKGEEEDKEETQADEQVVEIQSDISKKGEEKEDIQEREKVRIPETGSSSRLSTRSQESEEEASSASSSSTTSSIDEEPNMTISQVTEQDVRTQESINSDAKTEKPAKNKFFKRVKKDWKKCFSKKTALVSQSHEDEAPGSNLTCSPVKDQKEQYEAPAEQTSFALEQQFTEPLEERRAEAEDELVMEIHSASSSEEDGPTEFSQGDNEAAADQTPVPNMSPVIRRFFQSLTEEQWREVSEGVYNRDVKEKLIDMCVDLLKFISDSVIRNVLRSLSQLSTTSRTAILKSPISSEHLKKFFNYDVESSVESSFSQAVSDTIGADIPVSISPDFTEAIATEALDVVNPVLSVAIKASVVKGSSSAVSPTSSQVSKDRAGKKTLAGAIKTMKSILTGRGSLVKRRVLKQKTPEPHTEKEEPVWISFTARPMTQDSPSPLMSSTRKDPPLSEATTDEVCSTTSKKKKKTKRPLCMRLFCCCCCCCCHDDDE